MPTHSRRNEPLCTLCTTAECNSTKLWINWSLNLLHFGSTKYLSKARWYLFHLWWSGNPCDTRSQLILLNRVGLQWIPRVVLRHHGLFDLLFPSPGLDCISNDLWLVLIIYSPIMVYDRLYDRSGMGATWLWRCLPSKRLYTCTYTRCMSPDCFPCANWMKLAKT